MNDYKISARIDLDQAQKDWDKLVAMANTAAPKITSALKSSGEVSKQTKSAKETTKSFADLTGQTNKLIREMDELTRARKLDNVAVAKAQREAKELTRALRKGSHEVTGYTHDMDRLTARTTKFSAVTRKAQEATAGWWKRFGAVAVGFGVAYRAINVLENGIAAYVEILREGLTAQDEFIELQAKLAMYSQLYASNAENFAEGFRLAAVNVAAFRKELPMAISSLSDLTQGVDEFVQHGYAINPMTAHAMVNFLDFTAMIAVSVGSTAKQIRQEIQSLFEGAQKPGNQMLRLLKSLIPEFDKFLDRLRGTETETAMQELFEKISGPMDNLKKMMLEMSATKAHTVWRKQLILDVEAAARLAASMEGLAEGTNIFAMVFVRHMTTMSEAAKEDLAEAFVGLAHAFDSLLDKAPGILVTLTKLTWALSLLSEQVLKYGEVLLYSSAIFMFTKVLKGLGTALMLLPIARLAKFGKAMQAFGKVGFVGALGAGTVVHIANLMTKEFEMCAAAGVDLDNVLIKLQKDLRAKEEFAAVSAIQLMIDDGHEAAEILGLIASKWDKATVGGELFWKTVEKLNITFDETTVLGKALKKMFGGVKDEFTSTEGPMKEYMEWLEIYKEKFEDVADATTILAGITLSFYKDMQAAAKAGDVGRVEQLQMLALEELGLEIEEVEAKMKLLGDALSESPDDKKLMLGLAQLTDKLSELSIQLVKTSKGVPLFVAQINDLHRSFTTQISEIKSRAIRTGTDLSAELQKVCRDFYVKINLLTSSMGTLVNLPEAEKALKSLNDAIDKTLKSATKAHKKATEEVDELWTYAMDRVQSLMADTFMTAMKGKLNSFADVFKAFCDILLRYWAEMLAQMVMQSRVLQGITAGLGGIFSGFFGGGGTALASVGAGGGGGASGISPMTWASFSTGAYNIGQQIYSGFSSAFGLGGGTSSAAVAQWSSVGGFPTANIGGASGASAASGLGTWIQIGGRLYLAYSAISSFTEGDYAAGGVHAAALAAATYGGPWGWAAAALMEVGLFVKKMFFGENKKRSYLGREYTYGDYSLDSGWDAPEMVQYKDKRKGEKAFGESAEAMAQSGVELANAMDSTFRRLLNVFGEDWEARFTTAMGKLSIEKPTFDFYISAEDKGEFKEDWRKSWQAMTESLLDPIITVGTDLLKKAFDSVISDSSVWNYFTEDFKTYLQDSLDQSLADLQIDWSLITDEESFKAALEQAGIAAENIAAIVEHFETIEEIFASISEAIEFRDLSESARDATSSFREINAQFDQFAMTLESFGVDLEKYTDLETAHLIALQDAAKVMSDSAISGEDLAIALQHMSDSMIEAGHSAEEIADAMDAVQSGILESIDDIKKRYEDYGKTALDLIYEKYPEWSEIDYEQWAGTDLTDWSIDMLQEWRNLGDLLELQWEEQQAALADSLTDIVDSIEAANKAELDELEKLVAAFTKASDAIIEYQESLLAGPGGMLPTDIQYAQASQQLDSAIQDLYSRDKETALAASQAIPDYVNQFLEASKAFAATPEQYMADFAKAMSVLNTAGSISAKWLHDLENQMAGLNIGRGSGGHGSQEGMEYEFGLSPIAAARWLERGFDPSVYWPGYASPGTNNIPPPGSNLTWGMGMQSGGMVSGPESGFNAPITFHGTEHIVPGDQMGEVKNILGEVKEILVQVRDTNGDQNKTNKKLYRIIDRVSQGEEYLMTKAV